MKISTNNSYLHAHIRNPKNVAPFATWLRVKMNHYGFRASELCKGIMVSMPTVSLWLNGRRLPGPVFREKLIAFILEQERKYIKELKEEAELATMGKVTIPAQKDYAEIKTELFFAYQEQDLENQMKIRK
jgi:transcriptional regulator with XRE-family HTH domain